MFLLLLPLLFLLGCAAYQDFRFGEVSNKLWVYTPVGLVLFLLAYTSWNSLVWMLVFALFSCGLFYVGFGGADSKALLMVSLCYPLNFFPIIVFAGACVLSVLKFIVTGSKDGLRKQVRFVPYMFVSMLFILFIDNLFYCLFL